MGAHRGFRKSLGNLGVFGRTLGGGYGGCVVRVLSQDLCILLRTQTRDIFVNEMRRACEVLLWGIQPPPCLVLSSSMALTWAGYLTDVRSCRVSRVVVVWSRGEAGFVLGPRS